jgi:transposase-like protein
MKKRTQNSSAQHGRLARRKYDDEFKQRPLAMVRNGQSARSVAEAPGISENLIHQWKRAARASQSAAELEVEQLRSKKIFLRCANRDCYHALLPHGHSVFLQALIQWVALVVNTIAELLASLGASIAGASVRALQLRIARANVVHKYVDDDH